MTDDDLDQTEFLKMCQKRDSDMILGLHKLATYFDLR